MPPEKVCIPPELTLLSARRVGQDNRQVEILRAIPIGTIDLLGATGTTGKGADHSAQHGQVFGTKTVSVAPYLVNR